MQPIDFRYRMSDQGRIVLGPLSSEETLEFEVLSRRDREGRLDLPSELRLLELYVKYSGSSTQVPLAPLQPVDEPFEHERLEPAYAPFGPADFEHVDDTNEPLPWRKPQSPRSSHNYVVPIVVVMSVGFMLIAMLTS
ncbi:hypothetical protein IC761_06010 [Bradyrhizobium commune]|uniref:Uncharacterized protein n=2 Tax=Bradyrhizobium commune TaxID=83627 RepID=A0A7S9H2W7_9BRAD|nr:hypothetical protein IC761_06010 [Bradyrhizobium commune]